MSLLLVLLIGIGLLLIYSAVKNKNPVNVVKDVLKGA
jgi:hypothetical protein